MIHWLLLALLPSPAPLAAASAQHPAPASVAPPPQEASRIVRADFDGDGQTDLYSIAPQRADLLLVGQADGSLADATRMAGLDGLVSRLALACDFDREGHLDLLLLAESGQLALYRNDGTGRFQEATQATQVEQVRNVLHAEWLDYDEDGWSDLWIEVSGGMPQLLRNAQGLFEPVPLGTATGTGGSFDSSPLVAGAQAARALHDLAFPGSYLTASSVPTPGRLFPLTPTKVPGLNSDRIDDLDSTDLRLASQAIQLADLAPNAVDGSKVVDGSITSADLAANSVFAAEIADGAVGFLELANNAVSSAKVANDSLTAADIAAGAIGASELASNAVDSSKVANDSLTSADLAANSVFAAEIANGAVGSSELATNAVSSSKVADNSLTAADIAANAVGSSELAANSVFSTDIVDGSIVNADVSGFAAIAGTKVDPDFGSQDVVTTGSLGVQTTVPDEELVVGDPLGHGWVLPAATIGKNANGGALTIGQGTAGYYLSLDAGNIFNRGRIVLGAPGGFGTGTLEIRATGGIQIDGSLSSNGGDLVVTDNVVSSIGDFYTSSNNGVINCGGGMMNAVANVIADTVPTIAFATGDEELFIQGDLEVLGTPYKPGGGSWASVSDARLKRNVRPFEGGLSEVLAFEPVWFQYTDALDLPEDRSYVGVIAQEVRDVAPYMVEELPFFRQERENEDGTVDVIDPGVPYLTLDASALPYLLVNAIKEQQAVIEELEAECELLRLRLEGLEQR